MVNYLQRTVWHVMDGGCQSTQRHASWWKQAAGRVSLERQLDASVKIVRVKATNERLRNKSMAGEWRALLSGGAALAPRTNHLNACAHPQDATKRAQQRTLPRAGWTRQRSFPYGI